MERSVNKVTDNAANEIFDFIFRNAMGNIVKFNAAPTLAQMKANTMGFYGQVLYIKFSDGTGISISGTALS